ncbi:MSHA biogenesis protein MshI [Vibrio sp. M260118]|uniref:MSHA biogenesis protein MshI n=1 Tax=Vibrio sp. M260118 TaxID=3020896 RepID=UPI002F3F34BC
MNIQSLFDKLKTGKQAAYEVYAVVQPSAIFFSAPQALSLPSVVPVEGVAWQELLVKVLRDAQVSNLDLKLVLHSSIYQTFQIEKPNIPQQELKAAIPFLVKDLISEKVADVVADFSPVSVNNKLQVYVVQRALVAGLYESLKQIKVDLACVCVEDEIWGHSANEMSTFLLLQRSKQGQFRISAFVDSQCAFQRTIRGLTAPLTGVATSALQLDSLALELQRSIDYLSSQMRSASLHQLQVCCDEEQHQDLVQNLSESLSVKVTALSEAELESGAVLVQTASQLEQVDINLFPEDLKPKKAYFTLKNVALGWLITAGVLSLAYAGVKYQNSQLQQELAAYQSREKEYQQEVESLSQRLAKHKPSAAKVAAIARLKQEIEAKRHSLEAINGFDESQQIGYSGVMRSLAELGRNDISLSSITIDEMTLDLQGLAREAKAIPNWVNQFKTELNLVGRTFERLTIGRNEDNIITFELKTQQEDD